MPCCWLETALHSRLKVGLVDRFDGRVDDDWQRFSLGSWMLPFFVPRRLDIMPWNYCMGMGGLLHCCLEHSIVADTRATMCLPGGAGVISREDHRRRPLAFDYSIQQ